MKPLKSFFDKNKELRFSRIPIYQGNRDHVIGYALKDEIFKEVAEDHDEKLLTDLKKGYYYC